MSAQDRAGPAPHPDVDIVRLAELRARVDHRLTSRYGENVRELPVSREALARREQAGP